MDTAFFSHLLRVDTAEVAKISRVLFSTKNSKNTYYLGGCSVMYTLNLKKWVVKIHNCTLLLDIFAFFGLYRTRALIF